MYYTESVPTIENALHSGVVALIDTTEAGDFRFVYITTNEAIIAARDSNNGDAASADAMLSVTTHGEVWHVFDILKNRIIPVNLYAFRGECLVVGKLTLSLLDQVLSGDADIDDYDDDLDDDIGIDMPVDTMNYASTPGAIVDDEVKEALARKHMIADKDTITAQHGGVILDPDTGPIFVGTDHLDSIDPDAVAARGALITDATHYVDASGDLRTVLFPQNI